MKWLLSMPSYRQLWEAQRTMFSDEFVAHVDSAIASLPPESPVDPHFLAPEPRKPRRKRMVQSA
jgi:hypothetical protein